MRGLALALVVVIATAAVACANSYSAVGALELSDETYGSCVSCVSCVLCVSCVGVAARWLVSDESLGFRCKACVNRVADICIYIYIFFLLRFTLPFPVPGTAVAAYDDGVFVCGGHIDGASVDVDADGRPPRGSVYFANLTVRYVALFSVVCAFLCVLVTF